MVGEVIAVARSAEHRFSKSLVGAIRLVAGVGVGDDAHAGTTVQHQSRVRTDPSQPNLRQVHLLHAELFEELGAKGFCVFSGDIGEDVTTRGLELLGLPRGALLRIGSSAVVEVTGLRNPCRQLDAFQPGLRAAMLDHDPLGGLIRKAGIMAIVVQGGEVQLGDIIEAELPPEPYTSLEPV